MRDGEGEPITDNRENNANSGNSGDKYHSSNNEIKQRRRGEELRHRKGYLSMTVLRMCSPGGYQWCARTDRLRDAVVGSGCDRGNGWEERDAIGSLGGSRNSPSLMVRELPFSLVLTGDASSYEEEMGGGSLCM